MGYVVVFVGAGIGGALRHFVGWASLRLLGPNFPYGTLFVNIVGSTLMGLFIALLAARNVPGQNLRLFLTTGLLGGFTTFSTFSLDTMTLWQRGQVAACVGYVLVSVLVSLIGLFSALLITRGWGH